MKLNKLKTLMSAAIFVTALALGAAIASAATCNVPADHATIQSAVDDLNCTTINVAAGTYAEGVSIGRAVTLAGPNSGVSALGILPGLGIGGELAAVGERGPVFGELALVQWAASASTAANVTSDRIAIGLRAAALRLGWRIGELPVRAFADGELGSMTGSGMRSGAGTWLAFGIGLAGWWQVTPRLRAVATAEADLARDRVRFTLSDGTPVYEPGLSSARVTMVRTPAAKASTIEAPSRKSVSFGFASGAHSSMSSAKYPA